MNDHPKQLKRQLRELAATAHELAMRQQLELLAADFEQWRAGKLGTWELVDRIHRYHDGPNRDLFVFYTDAQPDIVVAHAIVTGLLTEAEVPAEVRQALARLIELRESSRQAPVAESETSFVPKP